MSDSNNSLLLAVLSLDSYNRGYNRQLFVGSSQVGSATFRDVNLPPGAQGAGFFASAYTLDDGSTVISYRGTDNPSLSSDGQAGGSDLINGWTVGAGFSAASQVGMAESFYETVAKQSVFAGRAPTNLTVTGHSLGGGLAGFIATLTGGQAAIFDNMPFGVAVADALVSKNWLAGTANITNLLVDGISPGLYSPALGANINQFFTAGEALQSIRAANFAANPLALGFRFGNLSLGFAAASYGEAVDANLNSITELDAHAGIVSPVDLHSMSLLTLLLYAQQNNFTAWSGIGESLHSALFSDQIATALGFVQGKDLGTNSDANVTGSAPLSSQMDDAIAYTVLSSGGLPFGNTAAQSLFSDADLIGTLENASRFTGPLAPAKPDYNTNALQDYDDGSTPGRDVADALTEIAVQFAGDQARAANQDADLASGAINVTGSVLQIDLDPTRFLTTFEQAQSSPTTPYIVGLGDLVTNVLTNITSSPSGGSSPAQAYVASVVTGDPDFTSRLNQITLAELALGTGGDLSGAGADATSDAGPGGALLVGQIGQGSISGSPKGNDIIVGGSTVTTGKGDDIIFAQGTETLNLGSGNNKVFATAQVDETVNYASTDGTDLILGNGQGGDRFTFKDADEAAFTVVWGGDGGNTYDFDADTSAKVNVVVLQMSGVTSATIGQLDVTKLENDYGVFGAGTVVILNPTTSDVLEYNGVAVNSPSLVMSGTDDTKSSDSSMVDGYRLYEGLKVGPENFSTTKPSASISTEWAEDERIAKSYDLESDGFYFDVETSSINIDKVLGQVSGETYESGLAGNSTDTYNGQQLASGGLSLSGFQNGLFGIDTSSGGAPYSVWEYKDTSYNVQSWATANISFNSEYNYYNIFGTKPAAEKLTSSSDSFVTYGGYTVTPEALPEVDISNYLANSQAPDVAANLLGGSRLLAADTAPPSLNVTVADFLSDQADLDAGSNGFGIVDTSQNISSAIDTLDADPNIVSITLTDGDGAVLKLTAEQALVDTAALALILTRGTIEVDDTAANVSANFEALASAADISAIDVVDGEPLTLSAAEAVGDSPALAKLSDPSEAIDVTDKAANVSLAFDALATSSRVATIAISDGAPLVLSVSQVLDESAALSKFTIQAPSIVIDDTAENVLQRAASIAAVGEVQSIEVTDNVANLEANLDALAADSEVSAITVQDTAAAVLNASSALEQSPLVAAYDVFDTAADIAASFASLADLSSPVRTVVQDSAANVVQAIDALDADKELTAVVLTDPGTPSLTLTASQIVDDVDVLELIANPTVAITVADSAIAISSKIDSLNAAAAAGEVQSITLTGGSDVLQLDVAQALGDTDAFSAISEPTYTFAISDTAADLSVGYDALDASKHVSSLTITDATTQPLTLDVAQATDAAILGEITNTNYSISIVDDANAVSRGFDALSLNDRITSISLTDPGEPTLHLSLAQISSDAPLLESIQGSYEIAVTDTAANVLADTALISGNAHIESVAVADSVANIKTQERYLAADPQISAINVLDSAANVSADIDSLAADPLIRSISINEAGVPNLVLTAAQVQQDARALREITNTSYSITVVDTAANVSRSIDTLDGCSALAAIFVTDGASAPLVFNAAQATGDALAIGKIDSQSDVPIEVADTSGDVARSLDALNADTAITSINLTDPVINIGGPGSLGGFGSSPSLSITASSALADQSVISKITNPCLQTIVEDTAANVAANLDGLAQDTQVSEIELSDLDIPTMVLEADQVANDTTALYAIGGFYAIDVQDNAGAVSRDFDALSDNYYVASIELTDSGTAALTLNAAQTLYDTSTLALIKTPGYLIDVTDSVGSVEANLPSLEADQKVRSIAVVDNAADVSSAIDFIDDTQAVTSVTLTDGESNALSLSAAETLNDRAALAKILNPSFGVDVTDTAADVSEGFDALAVTAGISSVTLTDPGAPVLTLTAQQTLSGSSLFADVENSSWSIDVVDTAANVIASADALSADAAVGSIHVVDTVAAALQNQAALAGIAKLVSVEVVDTASNVEANGPSLASDTNVSSVVVQDTAVNVLAAQDYIASSVNTTARVVDTGSAIAANLDALAQDTQIDEIDLSDAGSASLAISASQLVTDSGILAELKGDYSLVVEDNATNVVGALDELAADSHVTSIHLTGTSDPSLSLSAGQIVSDAQALKAIDAPFGLVVSDTAAAVAANLDALAGMPALSSIVLTDEGTPTLTLTPGQLTSDAGALDKIDGDYQIAVVGSAADVAANLGALGANRYVGSITLTDFWPSLDLSATQAAGDGQTLGLITNSFFGIEVTDTAANVAAVASTLSDDPSIGFISVVDTAAGVAANADVLAGIPKLSSVTLTDAGTPTLVLTAAQAAKDQTLINALSQPYSVVVEDTAAAVVANFDALANDPMISSITLTDAVAPVLTLTAAQAVQANLLYLIANPVYSISVSDTTANVTAWLGDLYYATSITTTDAPIFTLSIAQLSIGSVDLAKVDSGSYSVVIDDTASNVAANMAMLESDTHITSIDITDTVANVLAFGQSVSSDPRVGLLAVSDSAVSIAAHFDELAHDPLVGAVAPNDGSVVQITASQAVVDATLLAKLSAGSVGVFDTLANIGAAFDQLAASPAIAFISPTDPGILYLTTAQMQSDGSALSKLVGSFEIEITDASGAEDLFTNVSTYGDEIAALDARGHFGIVDTGANLSAGFSALKSDPFLDNVDLLTSGPLQLTALQATESPVLLGKIDDMNYRVSIQDDVLDVLGAQAAIGADAHVVSVDVEDLATNVSANIDALAADTSVTSITIAANFPDPTLFLSAAQALDDGNALSKITNADYQITIEDTASDVLAHGGDLAADSRVTAIYVTDTIGNVLTNAASLAAVAKVRATIVSDNVANVLADASEIVNNPAITAIDVADTAANILGNGDALSSLPISSIAVTDTVAGVLASEQEIAVDYQISEVDIVDTAAAVSANLDALSTDWRLSSITLTDANPVLSVSVAQLASDATVLSDVLGTVSLSVSGSAQDVSDTFDTLNADARIVSITISDAGPVTLDLTAEQTLDDGVALAKITNSDVKIAVSASVAEALTEAGMLASKPQITTVSVVDSAKDISSAFDALNEDTHAANIDVDDGGPVVLSIGQIDQDSRALAELQSGDAIEVNDTANAVLSSTSTLATLNGFAGATIVDTAAAFLANQSAIDADQQVNAVRLLDTATAVASVADIINADALVTEVDVADSAEAISAEIDILNGLNAQLSISLTGAGSSLALSVRQAEYDSRALYSIKGTYDVRAYDTAANILAAGNYSLFSSVNVVDTAADLSVAIDGLEALSDLGTVTLDDEAPTALTLSAAQTLGDGAVLAAITNPQYGVAVVDTAADISANLDALEADDHVVSIAMSDSGVPGLSISEEQARQDQSALAKIVNPEFAIQISQRDDQNAPLTIVGSHEVVDLDSVSLIASEGSSAVLAGSNDTVSVASGAQLTATGSNEVFTVSGQSTAIVANQTTVTFANGAGGSLSGTQNVMLLSGGNSVALIGSGGVANIAGAGVDLAMDAGTVNMWSATTTTLDGSDNQVTIGANAVSVLTGSNNMIQLQGTGVTLTASGSSIALSEDSSSALSGSDDGVQFGKNSSVMAAGTGNVFSFDEGDGNGRLTAAAGGSAGTLQFGIGVTDQNLWFAQSGNDLDIELMGSKDAISVTNWFSGDAAVQSFGTSDGMKLDAQVSQLVSAMATFSANNPGFDPAHATQAPRDPSLQSALASAWHG